MDKQRPDDPALRALYWRDEILQVMYWLSGEGLAEDVTAQQLGTFLDEDSDELALALVRLARDGYVGTIAPGRYTMMEKGAEHGKRGFADEFAGMVNQAHGECGADCWCHRSKEDAAACLADRAAGRK